MAQHQFLSDEWFAAVEALVSEHRERTDVTFTDLSMNLVVTATPFGPEQRLFVGAREGHGYWGPGHEAGADVTVTTDYETAKEVLFSGDQNAGMAAFLAGRVKIQGDLAKLLASQVEGVTPETTIALTDAVRSITA